jgi:hypothetical protein
MIGPFRLWDLPIYQGWFSDPDTQRWVSRPDDHWWVYVSAGGQSACWALEDAGILGGEGAWGPGSCVRSWPTIVKTSKRSQPASRPTIEQALL